MSFKKLAIAAGTALIGVAATTGASLAAPAVATGNVNVRSGPGTGYAVVDQLRRGQPVDVRQCSNNNWCYVVKSGPDGWVSSRFLSRGTTGRPDANFSIEFNFGNGPGQPQNPGQGGRACFFEHAEFQGASFCANRGERVNYVGNDWNDRISSVQITGGATVRVFQDIDFGGEEATIRRDNPALNLFNDQISSFIVR